MSTNINKSLVAFLVNGGKDVKGILAAYDPKAVERGEEKPTFYKVPATMCVEVGDVVTVPTSPAKRFGLTTNKVIKIDVAPDYNSKADVNWVAGCVKTKGYEDCLAFEEKIIESFQEAEQRKLAAQMEDTMKEVMGDVMNNLPALPSS